jgi:uncharacterized protein (DUF58 family)
MSAGSKPSRKRDVTIGGAALLMILCCAIGPAVIGAAAGSVIGGWLGVACAVLLAGVVGLVMHRRSRNRAC